MPGALGRVGTERKGGFEQECHCCNGDSAYGEVDL
jgi:hypothetical protein